MHRSATCPLYATLCALSLASELRAQETPRSASSLAGGLGVARATFATGESTRSATGLTAIARFQYRKLVLDLEFHPYNLSSPVVVERFSAVYALAGLQLGHRTYLTPAIGLQFRRWTGSQRRVAADNGLALGATLGTRLPLGQGATVSPELAVRAALIEVHGSVVDHLKLVTTRLLTVRLILARGL